MPFFNIEKSVTLEVNTDPQKRCYNGCHFSSELIKAPWQVLEYNIPQRDLLKRLSFWRGMNDYAVSQRGKSAKVEYRSVPTNP
jgi:hypothetical protein